MNADDLVALVQQDVETHGKPFPPATPEAVAELEATVGHPMPPLMKRIYLEVADGGFGYWHGALPLVYYPSPYRYIEGAGMIEEYREWRSDPDEHGRPSSVVPLLTWGCAMWLFVDFSTPEGRTWGWDPNMFCDRHRLYPEPFTFAEYVADWFGENELRKWRPRRDPDCGDCLPSGRTGR